MTASARERDPRRRLGAFYTPPTTARVMTDWVLRLPSDRVLEPSFGDGSFLSALADETARRGWPATEVVGVEIDPEPFGRAISDGLIPRGTAVLDDFLAVPPRPVEAALGNPPFVRLRHLPTEARERALRLTEEVLGLRMQSSGSVWMAFVLHAARFLRPGGRLAMVLPYELTYVRYARPLWRYLGATFGHLTVLRSRDRLFPDILQEAVVLLADRKGRTTATVELKAYENAADLGEDRPSATGAVPLERVVEGERVFLEALLPASLQELLPGKLDALTRPASAMVDFRTGYVTGDKGFFHPAPETVAEHALPPESLVPAVTSTRKLKGAGLRTSGLTPDLHETLFLARADRALSPGEASYVAAGERDGVHLRYKCSIRRPWYVVPSVKRPDLILTVFCELPHLMLNDARLAASNSMLCGYVKDGHDAAAFTAAWYTSLTALQCELQVHSLGGGVLVLVPREASSVRVPADRAPATAHLDIVSAQLAAGKLEAAYEAGDEAVLRPAGLSRAEIELVEEGAAVLRRWRSARRQ